MDTYIENALSLAESEGIKIDPSASERLEIYSRLLREWNEKMNLTAVADPEGIAIKHFYDSLLLLGAYDIKEGASLIDVGTGAGFPGLVIKIARPDIKLTLLDSLNKRLVFLREVLSQTGLEAETVHARAEDAAKPPLRESFDVATARAVASLPVLCEYCLPYVKNGGCFIAMKGPAVEGELEAGERAAGKLGGQILSIEERYLPGKDKRNLVIIKKSSQTPTLYPRNSAKISKFPL